MISVLYVDDEQSLLEIARLFLEETGDFRVGTALSAQSALKDDSIRTYDAIISDYQMPGMDGIAFLKIVREKYGDIPFILFTGRGREEVVIEAINNGADFYLQKGGDPEAQFVELAHKIRQSVRRKQAEYSLHDSERRLTDIIDFLPDATFAIDKGGRVIAWNRAIEEMTGISAAEMLGKGDYAYAVPFYGERRPMVLDLIDQPDEKIPGFYTNVYRTGTSLTAETDHTHPKGHQIIVLIKACHLYNQAGEITGAIESIRDISERKNLEMNLEKKHLELLSSYEQVAAADEELREHYDELARSERQIRESETRYRSIVENSPLGMHFYELRSGGELIFTGANPSADRILGIDHSRYIGKSIETAFPQLVGTEIPEQYRAVAEHGGIWQKDQIIYDGEEIRGAYAVIAFQTAPRSMVAVFEDITDKKQKEEELAFDNALLSTQQDTSLDAILVVDENGKIINYNRQFIALWGLPEDLVEKRDDEPVLQYVTGKLADPEAFLSRVKYLYDHQDEKSFEELLLKDGKVLERFSAPMLGEGGKYYGRVWYFRDITLRKQAEKDLRASEERLRQFIQQAPAAIAMFDREMRYIAVSRRWIADYHLGDRDFIGLSHYDIFPELTEEIKNIHRRALAGEIHSSDEDKFVRQDGSVQWVSWEVRPWYTTSNDIGGIILYSEDITKWKMAEDALRRSEEKYRFLTENSDDIIYSMDLAGTITHVSPKVSQYGFSPDQLIGHNISEFIPEEDLLRIQKDIRTTVETGQSTRTTFRLKGDPEKPVWLEDNGAVIKKADGIAVGITGILRDITERKLAETALRESETKFHRLAENAPDMIYRMTLPDARYEYVSPACVALTGYAPEEFYAEPGLIRKLIHPAWTEYLQSQWQALLENRAPPFYEYQIVDKSGKIRWVNQRNMLVTDDQGRAVAIEGIVTDVTRQKTSERELRRSELRSLAVSENAGEWIWEVDAGGIYRYSSPAVTKILGYRPEELVGKMHYYDFFDPSVREELKSRTFIGFASHEPFRNFINVNRHRNGTQVILSTSATPVFDDTGAFTGYCGVDEDITEKQQAQEEITRSRQQLAEAMDLAHLVNWEYDPGTDLFTFDDRFYALYGTTAQREGGSQMSSETYAREFVHPDDRWMVADEARKALETTDPGYTSHVGHRIIRRDGEVRYISVRIAITKDGSGRTIKTHGANQDITDRKKTEEELEESRRMLAKAMDLANIVDWEFDLTTHQFVFNDRFYALYHTTAEKEGGYLMGPERYIREFVHPDDRDAVATVLESGPASASPGMDFQMEHRIIRRDGEVRFIIVRVGATSDLTGRGISIHGANQDITGSKQAEEALRQAHRKLHLLTGITRHDISNQLMTLNGFVGLLRKKVTDPALETHFTHITDASRQISTMIAFTKEYEKIGVHAPVWQTLATVVEDAAKGILPGQVIFRNDLPAGMEVFADPLIVKVFYNLLDNSIRHGQRVTEVRVSSHISGETLVVVWEDNGIGIDQEEKERIFERGFGKNTGLGMFLAREILSLTNITIHETGKPYSGARFEMTVPRGAYRDTSQPR